jgi:hypothetical protein
MSQATALEKPTTAHADRDVLRIIRLSSGDLERLMREGTAPELADLEGWEFAGTNLGAITDLVRIRKFKKGFYRGAPRDPRESPGQWIQGYNVAAKQDGVGRPHRAHPSEERPKRHGFYRVGRVHPGARDAKYPNALLLDYGLGRNGAAFSAVLRDYLVQPYPDDPDLLLGKAYAAVFGVRIPVGWFVLVRHNRHEFKGQ